jgi:hypothetical protein
MNTSCYNTKFNFTHDILSAVNIEGWFYILIFWIYGILTIMDLNI